MKRLNTSWIALIGICLASFLGCIDFTIVNTALPSIQTELNTTVTTLQWVINIFMLTLAAFMVVMGRIADIYGRRRLLYIGMALFGLSSLGAGLSHSISWLILFRCLQGVAVAILYTVPVAMIPSLFPRELRGKATGILIGVNGFGLAVGPVIGGFILSVLSWHWVFYINLPIILLSLAFCLKTLPESMSHEHGKRIDWWGFILLVIALPTVVLATVEGSAWGWTSTATLGLYAVSAVSLGLFYIVEQRSTSPIISFKLFANRPFIVGILANVALAFFYTLNFFLLPLYLHNLLFETGFEIGLVLLPATALVALLSPVVGTIVDKVGPKKVLMVGFLLFIGSSFLQSFFSADTSMPYILGSLILLGIGWACILSPSIIAALSAVPESISGVAMGSLGTLHNFGGAMGLAIGTALYHSQATWRLIRDLTQQALNVGSWASGVVADPDNAIQLIQQYASTNLQTAQHVFAQSFSQGYQAAMWLLVGVSVLAFLSVLLGSNKRSKTVG